MKIVEHKEGKLYRVGLHRALFYLAKKDANGFYSHEFHEITVYPGAIVMKLPERHKYAKYWITVLYEEQIYFMDRRFLETEEVK